LCNHPGYERVPTEHPYDQPPTHQLFPHQANQHYTTTQFGHLPGYRAGSPLGARAAAAQPPPNQGLQYVARGLGVPNPR